MQRNILNTPTPLQILALCARLARVAALAHGLEWSVPKVAALRYRCDVIHDVGKVSALYADRIFTQK